MNKLKIEEFLKQVFLFQELSLEERIKVATFSTIQKLKRNEILFLQENKAHAFYLIVYGKLSIFRSSSDGQEQIIHLQQDKEVVAEAILYQKTNYPASCKALKESLVIKIDRESFLKTMQENPPIMLKMLSSYSKRLKEFVHMVEYLSLDDIEKRFLKYLQKRMNLLDKGKGQVILKVSKKELAGLLGTTPESLSRTLRKLKDQGKIREEKNKIIINDLNSVNF